MKDVTVAIVSHDHLKYLKSCLDSVFKLTKKAKIEVLLLDNCNDPEVRRFINRQFPEVKLVVNKRPLGFAENNNILIRKSKARYVLLLNPDTELLNDSIDIMLEFMDRHAEAGACAPKLLYPDGRLQLSCRRFPTMKSVLLRRTPLRSLFPEPQCVRHYTMADWDHENVMAVDWAFGASLMVRRCVLEDVGLLDQEMFLFSEDIDLCYRINAHGWKVYYLPHAKVSHDLDDDKYNRYFTKARRMHYKTMFRFATKCWKHRRGIFSMNQTSSVSEGMRE